MSLTEHVLTKYGEKIKSLTLVPWHGGVFEVWVNDEEVHSKRLTGQFPTEEEIDEAIVLFLGE